MIINESNRISSLKRSVRRSLWQLKADTHEHYELISLHFYIDGIIDNMGFDHNDVKKVCELEYGPNEIIDYDIKLRKTRVTGDLTYFEVLDKVHDFYLDNAIWINNTILRGFEGEIEVLFMKIREGSNKKYSI